jgi:hypothetical protein
LAGSVVETPIASLMRASRAAQCSSDQSLKALHRAAA